MKDATYVLLIRLRRSESVNVGSLGLINFSKGYYGYVGSAFGPGNLSRIKNHFKISKGEKERKRWHIDYLLSLETSEIESVFLTPEKTECELAKSIKAGSIDGFGCSDCECGSHLKFEPSDELKSKIREAFESLDVKYYRKQKQFFRN